MGQKKPFYLPFVMLEHQEHGGDPAVRDVAKHLVELDRVVEVRRMRLPVCGEDREEWRDLRERRVPSYRFQPEDFTGTERLVDPLVVDCDEVAAAVVDSEVRGGSIR